MWYSAALLFERVHPGHESPPDDPLWEESVILVDAPSEEDAKAKAEILGRAKELSFRAISGEAVEWRFVEVVETQEVLDPAIKTGTEVFSRFLSARPGTK